jgi:hypothetical protein
VKKALLVLLVIVLAGLLLWAFVPAKEKPVWQTSGHLVFLGFTNPLAGGPEVHAFFGFRGTKYSPYSWELLEISHQQNGHWKRAPLPGHFQKLHYAKAAPDGFMMGISVPVSTTNLPLRLVMEIGENGPAAVRANAPPAGTMGQFYRKWLYRSKKWLHPDNPARWLPPTRICRLTNEFNFPLKTE